jgi:hypothetical protein
VLVTTLAPLRTCESTTEGQTVFTGGAVQPVGRIQNSRFKISDQKSLRAGKNLGSSGTACAGRKEMSERPIRLDGQKRTLTFRVSAPL